MKFWRNGALILGAALIVGCATVYVTAPVGEKPVALDADEWNGAWSHGDRAVRLKVTDAAKGTLEAILEEKDKPQAFDVFLRQVNDWTMASLRQQDDDHGRYSWGRLKKHEDRITLWGPNLTEIRKLVEKDVLPGSVDEEGNVSLGLLTARHLDILTSDEYGLLVDWEHPIVLYRVAD